MKRFFYRNENGQNCGPLNETELRTLHTEGRIENSTPVIVEGDQAWERCDKVLWFPPALEKGMESSDANRRSLSVESVEAHALFDTVRPVPTAPYDPPALPQSHLPHRVGLRELSEDEARALVDNSKDQSISTDAEAIKAPAMKILAAPYKPRLTGDPFRDAFLQGGGTSHGRGWIDPRSLELDSLVSLSSDAAEVLGGFTGMVLSLNGLSSLSDDAANHLSKYPGLLYLNGIEAISDRALKLLFLGNLRTFHIKKIRNISEDVASAIAASNLAVLNLDNLTCLSGSVVSHLSYFGGNEISLDGLKSISDAEAKSLANFESREGGGSLSLSGLQQITTSCAAFLSNFEGSLHLNGITNLEGHVARELGSFSGRVLQLNGVEIIDKSAAEGLGRHSFHLELEGLQEISGEAAIRLFRPNGDQEWCSQGPKWKYFMVALEHRLGRAIFLNGITHIDMQAAEAISKYDGIVSMPGLGSLSEDSAQLLSQSVGFVKMGGLPNTSEKVKDKLLGSDNVYFKS